MSGRLGPADSPRDTVEQGDEKIRHGQVDEEVVGDGPHPPVGQHRPQHQCVAQERDHQDDGEGRGPKDVIKIPTYRKK